MLQWHLTEMTLVTASVGFQIAQDQIARLTSNSNYKIINKKLSSKVNRSQIVQGTDQNE